MLKRTSKTTSQKLRQSHNFSQKHFHIITQTGEWICKYKYIYVPLHRQIFISLVMRKTLLILFALVVAGYQLSAVSGQQVIRVGRGSYASFAPLSASRTDERGGSQAYQMEHRKLYIPDSLLQRLGVPDGSKPGTLALPTNDWWTHALVNEWTGKIWGYPYWAEATAQGVEIGYPDHWENTGCEVKWDTPLALSFTNTITGKRAAFKEALVDSWSDFMMSFVMQDGDAWVRVICVHGSPIVWVEAKDINVTATNPNEGKYTVSQQTARGKQWTTVTLLTEGVDAATVAQYAQRVPRTTRVNYEYKATQSLLSTTFCITTEDIATGALSSSAKCLIGFLPHHYYSNQQSAISSQVVGEYLSPRGMMKVLEGNDFTFDYTVHGYLPFFPQPLQWAEGFSATRMQQLNADYAARGTFGGDTYWGGKGLTQMMHYMSFALQMGDTATFRLAKQRLKETLIDWYTYTPGEPRFYFARYNRWGALVGFDCSYDSDTFNDHHFHYGYFVYASAVLCMLDEDFREQYGAMAREVARDYANWQRSADESWFRTLDPYCGHSFAGGLGNGGNGNGQESTSEAIQGWGGVWMLGAALGDQEMLEAGIFGYTLETRAAAEYWFDRGRRNIDFTKYQHPYCCNLTMQGVGWWTWFSGDPVWMHSIQWLPISPILTNFFSEDLNFTRWDYTEMYQGKEVGDYEAPQGGLGDESGLGNVCLSYLSLFDADSAARVWDRMDKIGKALAKNPDTGGITYWLTHSHKALGEKRYDILCDHPLACAYTDSKGVTTYAVYNAGKSPLTVHFFGAVQKTLTVKLGLTLTDGTRKQETTAIADETTEQRQDELAWNLPYPNLALGKHVTASSYENAGCTPQGVNDGKLDTRWGSEHRDNEYVTVDLEQECYIDHLILRWEAAYASKYSIGLSSNNTDWQTVTLSSSGGVETIYLSTLSTPFATQRGRYIRLTGIERATQYGTSLYEIEVYGRPLTGDASKIFVVALAATDTVLTEGQSTTLSATAYNVQGDVMNAVASYAVVSGAATLSGNRVTTTGAGEVIVKATVQGVEATLTLIVLEGEKITGVVVTPAEVTMPVGDVQEFAVSTINQFGCTVETCYYTYQATEVGDYTNTYECGGGQAEVTIHVLPYATMNLALGKPVIASSYENAGTLPEGINDGQMNTRWGSAHYDNEWVEIDLEHCYLLDSVRLVWETAYATDYDLMVSDDAEVYETVYAATNTKGGTQLIRLPEGCRAQYVRLLGKKRSTNYGISLFEMEIYGSGRCEPEVITAQPSAGSSQPVARKVIRDGKLLILREGKTYTIFGQKVRF